MRGRHLPAVFFLIAGQASMLEDLILHEGRAEKPAVVLIHGLGMTRHFWGNPALCPVLGEAATLQIFLGNRPERTEQGIFSLGNSHAARQGVWDRLADAGYCLAAWSQAEPLGPVALAIDELAQVLVAVREQWPGKKVILLGHSRGGLIARSALLSGRSGQIAALVTLGSPHGGTKMASLGAYLQPVGKVLQSMLPGEASGTVSAVLKRISVFLASPAIGELRAESAFVGSLAAPLPQDLPTLSFAGSAPDLFRLYYRISRDSRWRSLSLPELLAKAVPARHLPEEMQAGLGDGLVRLESARLGGSVFEAHECNHVALAFSPAVQDKIARFLNTI